MTGKGLQDFRSRFKSSTMLMEMILSPCNTQVSFLLPSWTPQGLEAKCPYLFHNPATSCRSPAVLLARHKMDGIFVWGTPSTSGLGSHSGAHIPNIRKSFYLCCPGRTEHRTFWCSSYILTSLQGQGSHTDIPEHHSTANTNLVSEFPLVSHALP